MYCRKINDIKFLYLNVLYENICRHEKNTEALFFLLQNFRLIINILNNILNTSKPKNNMLTKYLYIWSRNIYKHNIWTIIIFLTHKISIHGQYIDASREFESYHGKCSCNKLGDLRYSHNYLYVPSITLMVVSNIQLAI